MGINHKKRYDLAEKEYGENIYNYKEEERLEKYRRVIEYENFCKELKFVEGNEITVKVKEHFGLKSSINNSIYSDFPIVSKKWKILDKEIEHVKYESFYPHPYDECGGDTVNIDVFKANKKGNFKIEYGSDIIKVIVI